MLSNATIAAQLPSGNIAVYDVQPQHLNDLPGTTLGERARFFGQQIAVKIGNEWFHSGLKEKITDNRTVSLLENLSVEK